MTNSEIGILSQKNQIAQFRANGRGRWTEVSKNWRDDEFNSGGYFAVFSSPKVRKRALNQTGWDVTKNDGMPGFSQHYDEDQAKTEFHSNPLAPDFEPLLVYQDFNGLAPGRFLVSQTFVLVMELWEDPKSHNYYQILLDGTREIAIEFCEETIRFRTDLLRRYQAARQLDLLLFADVICKVATTIPDAELRKLGYDQISEDGLEAIHLGAGSLITGQGLGFSRLLMKQVLPPPPRELSGLWPWGSDEQYMDFIIGQDEVGRPVSFTCDPDQLANYFGSNEGNPNYMTPVFFKAEVLLKYFENPSIFSVSSSYLKCAGLWGLRIDYHRPDQVAVALGDLGRDLPEEERRYWHAYNVPPSGRTISEEHFQNSILGLWVDTSSPAERFKAAYLTLNETWEGRWGWPLFRSPKGDDAYLLKRVRVPLNETLSEFQGQVLTLAKLMVDQLNEKQLNAGLEKVEREAGISKFERFALASGVEDFEPMANLLRKIYKLRSKHTAHAGGDSGKEFKENLMEGRTSAVFFASLLNECVDVIRALEGGLASS